MARESAVFEPVGASPPQGEASARELPATLQELVMARLDRMSGDREVAQMESPTTIADESANVARIAAIGRRPEPENGEKARRRRLLTPR